MDLQSEFDDFFLTQSLPVAGESVLYLLPNRDVKRRREIPHIVHDDGEGMIYETLSHNQSYTPTYA